MGNEVHSKLSETRASGFLNRRCPNSLSERLNP
jgi:hypothetical protein